MKYDVIDIMPGMNYAPGDEVLGAIEASSADEAIAKVMRSIGVDSLKAWDPAGYEKHILAYVKAVEVK
jgi:hypothetical protein